jgi:AcrR family transcriptional regulator
MYEIQLKMARIQSVDAHNRVLEAALELFVERGIESTTMDALAATSGVSKATIYKHWPEGKEPLLMELLLVVVGIEEEIAEEDSGDLLTDLARVLNGKPQNARPEDQKRLMPQMVAYSATHQDFGNAWRSRVMERPRQRIRRIVTAAIEDGRLPPEMDMNICFAILLGPLMYQHIFGRPVEGAADNCAPSQSILGMAKTMAKANGTAKAVRNSARGQVAQVPQGEKEIGTWVAETFCRAFEIKPGKSRSFSA